MGADTTANGFRWHADGAPCRNDWSVPAWMRLQHHSERFQKMISVAIPNIGNTGTFHTRDEAIAFGTRTDPERDAEQPD